MFYLQSHVVAQSVKAMCYKPKGRGFDSRIYDPGVNSGCDRNENQQYFLGVKAAEVYGWKSYKLLVQIVYKSWSFNLLEPSEPVQASMGIALPVTFALSATNLV